MPAAESTGDESKGDGLEVNAFKIAYNSLISLIQKCRLPKPKVKANPPSIAREVLKAIRSTNTDRPNVEDEVRNGVIDLNVYYEFTEDPVHSIGSFNSADMKKLQIGDEREPGFSFACFKPFFDKEQKWNLPLLLSKWMFEGKPAHRSFFTFYCILIITISTFVACLLTIPNSDWADVKGLQASFISSRNQLVSTGNDLKPKNADSWNIPFLRSLFLEYCFPLESMIYFGAIYSPCFYSNPLPINVNISAERDTGCCVENKKVNGSYVACFQSDESRCRDTNFDFVKNKNSIGPVCGRDPEYCTSPSRDSFDKEDITKWEHCSKTRNAQNVSHMNCETILRPCCLLTLNCAMYDEKQCQENEGTFHSDKMFCSQVNCFTEYCGSSYLKPIWRLYISPFLSAGFVDFSQKLHGWCSFRLPHYFFLIIMLAGQLQPIESYYGTQAAIKIYLVPAWIDNVFFIYLHPNFPSLSAIAPMVCLTTFLLAEVIFNTRRDWLNLVFNLVSSGFCISLHFVLLPHIKLSQIGIGFLVGLVMSALIRTPKQVKENANECKVCLLRDRS